MNKMRLNLPFTYQKWPEFFDIDSSSGEENLKNHVMENILKVHKVESVLDLTCGTGAQVFYLKKRDYDIVGADFSPALLNIARKRAKEEALDITFVDGDMRTLRAGTFDAVITIFNAIGHVTKKGFEKTLRNIYGNLKSGGIYIFDIFNLTALTDSVVHNFDGYTHKKFENINFFAAQCSTIDREKGVLTSYDNVMIQHYAEKPKQFHHTFSLQIYTQQELGDMLSRNGFHVLNSYDIEGNPFNETKSLNILTVAQKK